MIHCKYNCLAIVQYFHLLFWVPVLGSLQSLCFISKSSKQIWVKFGRKIDPVLAANLNICFPLSADYRWMWCCSPVLLGKTWHLGLPSWQLTEALQVRPLREAKLETAACIFSWHFLEQHLMYGPDSIQEWQETEGQEMKPVYSTWFMALSAQPPVPED